eukprot:c27935_g1_i1.p1 GENE.c27935_g1_i1~~c27935_g1_i1.p1  ORF type:complete len:298 (-),score=122.21 c27935_g1_i1:62-955(-)
MRQIVLFCVLVISLQPSNILSFEQKFFQNLVPKLPQDKNVLALLETSIQITKDEAFQYPYNMESSGESSNMAAMKKRSKIFPVDITKSPTGGCDNHLDIGGQISCDAAKIGAAHVEVPEGDENLTSRDIVTERTQKERPLLEVPKSQMDPPEEMSRREFFEFIVSEAKQKGAEKGREMGLAAGYLQAKLEAQQEKNITIQSKIQALSRSFGIPSKTEPESKLQVARLVYNALTKGESPHFRVDSGKVFDSEEEFNREENMADNAVLGLAAVDGVGKLAIGASDVITGAGEGLQHMFA